MRGAEFRFCTKCPVIHVENCESCYGFGLSMDEYEGIPLPIRAAEIDDPPLWKKCLECGGTPKGVDNERR